MDVVRHSQRGDHAAQPRTNYAHAQQHPQPKTYACMKNQCVVTCCFCRHHHSFFGGTVVR